MLEKNRPSVSIVDRLFRTGGIVLCLLAFSVAELAAGVLVAPTVVFLSDQNRTGRMTLQNTGETPQEVSLFLSFGLPESDSLGDVRVKLVDTVVTDPRACLEWVRAFPRRLILPPNASQVVRFVANPPRGLGDGEYWARVVVKAQAANEELPTPVEGTDITTRLNMVMQTAIMLKYRRGDTYCELELNDVQAKLLDDKVEVMLDMKSIGNASYLGMLHCRLVDAKGREVAVKSLQLAVYRDMRRRVTIPILQSQIEWPLEAKIEITSKGRTDIAAPDMLFGNDLSYSAIVE